MQYLVWSGSYLVSWPRYCNAYLGSGLAKSRSLFHAKIGKQRLQLMLPSFDLDSVNDGKIM